MCFLFLGSIINAQIKTENSIELITEKKVFKAGEKIVLEFVTTPKKTMHLYCSNSYGTTIIPSEIKNNKLLFTLPAHFSSKRGVLNWKLINPKKIIKGEIKIIPKDIPVSIETYIGPPSIVAGEKDYTMFVVIPTDNLDNPLTENSAVTIQQQFLNQEKKEEIFTKNLIGFKNIYSPLKSGRILLSSVASNLNSKEFTVNIMPGIGTNFKIFSQRNHNYADGNQITTFSTSVIRDTHNNVISDGSFVDFYIKNKKGDVLKTSGKTINGVATAKILHPEFKEDWLVKAYIIGIAESDEIKLTYKQVIKDFTVAFSNNNRTLKVGPLQSFMNQMIPDGLKVTTSIFKDGKLVDSIVTKSVDGFVNFELDANIYPNEIYKIKVSTAGITKSFNSIKLW
ncbi:hypothetical protein [Polaribacter aestuariivivens]|uniref:hypothetical protein n=1 Tax=Polaribacter aestuariivivens TaxID=2304626 RepID=UPI003F49AF04